MKLTNIMNEMAAASVVKMIKPTDKVIMSADDKIKFRNTKQREINSGHVKPTGLWYAIGKGWIEWVRSEMPEWENDNVFKITTTSKVVVLKNKNDCLKFQKKYGYSDKYYPTEAWGPLIDWQKVSKDYAGIELHYYNDFKMYWTYGWDVASGCIWNKVGIKKIIKYDL